MCYKKNLIYLLVFFAAAICYGSVPAFKSTSSTMARDILGLPHANRSKLLQRLSADDYKELRKISLSDAEPMNVRWKALMAMAQSRRPDVKSDILQAATSNVWYMRNAALVAMEEFDYVGAADLAKKMIQDKALVVRSAAVDILATMAQGDVRAILWEELNKSYNYANKQSLWIRGQIVEVLVDRPEKAEEENFTKLLDDPDIRVSYYATFGLEKLRGPIVPSGRGLVMSPRELTPQEKVKLWQARLKKNYIEL